MEIIIIFPEKFFTQEQLSKLNKYDLKFVEGKDIDLEKMEELYKGDDELILSLDPTYLKGMWGSLPVERVKRMKGLKALCLTTTSFSWVDGDKLRKLGVIVTNTPGKSTNAVAEFNIFMMLSLLRRLPLVARNKWKMDYDNFLNEEVRGLTAGIVGLGQIGARVAELCEGVGMKVCYWNRSKKDVPFKSVSLEGLFHKSDVVFNTIATPPELKGFLNKELLSKLKSTAIIVSTSTTHVLDEEFALKQVKKGNLGGYAFESNEKDFNDFKGNVMVFPEQAYYTRTTLENTARIVTDTILSVINGNPINRVN